MHSIRTRPPTEKERRLLGGQTGREIANLGCISIVFGIIPAFLLGKLGAWLVGFHSRNEVAYGRWAGWAAGLGIFIWTVVKFLPALRRERVRANRDAKDQIVQEVEVTCARVFEIHPIDEHEPILAFDIWEGKILFLRGQWLRETDTYGAPRQDDDPEEQFLNGLPKPFSFPSASFVVTRLPHSGKVLGIRVTGEYLAPGNKVNALSREFEFGDSELFEGELENIAEVLAREHVNRSRVAK